MIFDNFKQHVSTKVSSKQNTNQGMKVFKSLPWLVIKTYVSILSISFYHNFVCKIIACDMGLNSFFSGLTDAG